jgi:hypothetical protein
MGVPSLSFTCTTSGSLRVWTTIPVWASPETFCTCAGTCATVTDTVALALPAEAVIVALPLPAEVTNPKSLTVATDVAFDDQPTVWLDMMLPFWSLTVAVSWSVAPTATNEMEVSFSSIVVGTGVGAVPPSLQAQTRAAAASSPPVICVRRRFIKAPWGWGFLPTYAPPGARATHRVARACRCAR